MYKRYYIYIVSNKTNSTLYIGVTNNLERRIAEHKSGVIPGFTQKYNCHKLVYFEEFSDVEQAIAREKQLKKWSRAKKDWLIDMMNKERKDLMEECHPEECHPEECHPEECHPEECHPEPVEGSLHKVEMTGVKVEMTGVKVEMTGDSSTTVGMTKGESV